MLFNSYVFILAFLPVVLLGYVVLGRLAGSRPAQLWLTVASFFFYGWWNPVYLPLLLATTVFTYLVGRRLARAYKVRGTVHRPLLTFGIAANLALLGYFKYATFVVGNVEALFGIDFAMQAVVLPLGISFFVFQKIAYLVDAATGKAAEYDFVDYCLFVAFFPQLIAGPIVHHREIMSQFARPVSERLSAANFAQGVTFFTIGLAKKVLIADNLAPLADAGFAAVAAGEPLSAATAWRGALAYTFQLYFDFSGYSDMAIGLGLMFGIRLPFNFNSPYKATNISDFWRRWHMTLSRFLRDYVYVPLGGNRHGRGQRYRNLLLTMALGGLWHGAAWVFVIWGCLHGLYLVINHGWQALRRRLGLDGPVGPLGSFLGRVVTFGAVVVGWVFFRASSVEAALEMLQAMAGLNGMRTVREIASDPGHAALGQFAVDGNALAALAPQLLARSDDLMLLILLLAVWYLPNSQEIVDSAGVPPAVRWRPTAAWAVTIAGCLLASMTQMSKVSAFLYFQF